MSVDGMVVCQGIESRGNDLIFMVYVGRRKLVLFSL